MNSLRVSRPFAGLLAGAVVLCSPLARPASAAPKFSYDAPSQGSHVAALALNEDGSLWVGMEDFAVWNRTGDNGANSTGASSP